MAEEFVSRNEFNDFKKETLEKFKEIDTELKDDKELLHKIDKNITSIITKLEINDSAEKAEKSMTEKIVDLKLEPIKTDIDDLKGARKWATRLLIGELITILGLIIKATGVI